MCQHTLVKTGDPEQLPMLVFDWHRVFDTGRPVTVDGMRVFLRDAREAALTYFEDLAEGNRFDENIISGTTTT